MFGINYVSLVLAGLLSLGSFLVAWNVNGNRWEAKYQGLIAEQTEAALKAEKKARDTEKNLQVAIDNERKTKDEKIKLLSDQLSTALISLRQRPLRDTAVEPKSACHCKGADGSKLFREDAEFLVREAARADRAVRELHSCYRSYESVRDLLNQE